MIPCGWLWRGAGAVGLILIIVPAIDLGIARQFYWPGVDGAAGHFVWSGQPAAELAHMVIQRGSLVLALALVLAFLWCAYRSRTLLGLGRWPWLFLTLALVVGPGVVANLVLKDHWGRARPLQITMFGGTKQFTPPLVLSDQCDHNCSFVSGDPTVGFTLHAAAYVARRRQRTIFYGSMAAGLLIGLLRIGQGAHFFSDVLFAGAFMVATVAALHALMFGAAATRDWWRRHLLAGPKPAAGSDATPSPEH